MDTKGLRPTLWRTVRALNSERRLRLLKAVFSFGGEFGVRDFAKLLKIKDPLASVYLRHLNSRGLLGVRRSRMKVCYNTNPDRTLPEAAELQQVLKQCLQGEQTHETMKELLAILKAFAHFNRLAIITRLAEGPANLLELHKAIGGSVKTAYHHLRILYATGIIDATWHVRSPTDFHLLPLHHPLARILLKQTLNGKDKFKQYYNPPTSATGDAATQNISTTIAKAGTRSWRHGPRT